MFNLSIAEILIICIIGVLVFGAKLPEVMRQCGMTIRKLHRLFLNLKYDIEDACHPEHKDVCHPEYVSAKDQPPSRSNKK